MSERSATNVRQHPPFHLDVGQVASERIRHFVSEAIHYWRLIFSSGLLGTIIVLFIIGLLYYDDFLAMIPEQAPIAFFLALVLTYFVTRAPQRNFLQEADLMFLTVQEGNMHHFFQKTFRYNLILQCMGVFIVLVILAPLYVDQIAVPGESVWPYYVVPLILKGWNLQSNWAILKAPNERVIHYHTLLRMTFSFLFLYWLFSDGLLVLLAAFVFIVVLFFMYERKINENHAYHWLRLLDIERQRLSRFYSFCNAFVDVPHLQSKVRGRRWLANITRLIPFAQDQAYRYLYVKTFIRANDYFGIYVRLTLVGLIVLYAMLDPWVQGIIYVLFLFLVGTQLQAIWGHHNRQFWLSIFPLSKMNHSQAMLWLTFWLLSVQAIVMSLPIWGQSIGLAIAFIVLGILFAYVYSYKLLHNKLKKGKLDPRF